MDFVCKNIKLYESEITGHGGWPIPTFNLDFDFEFNGRKVRREIVWLKENVMFQKLFLKNERKLIRSIKESVKAWLSTRTLDLKSQEHQQEINLIIESFNNKNREITIKI